MHRYPILLALSSTMVLIWTLAGSASVLAHGGALVVSPVVATPGSIIVVSAEEVEDGEVFIITLQTDTFIVTLGTVTVENEGFRQEFVVPAHVPPGTYEVQAISAEDEVLSAELIIEAGEPLNEQSTTLEPSNELMDLDRSKTSSEQIVIIAVLVVSAVLGGILLLLKK